MFPNKAALLGVDGRVWTDTVAGSSFKNTTDGRDSTLGAHTSYIQVENTRKRGSSRLKIQPTKAKESKPQRSQEICGFKEARSGAPAGARHPRQTDGLGGGGGANRFQTPSCEINGTS